MKHIVSYSGGVSSFLTAKRVIEKYGKENTLLVFCDTMTEDEDLYRFNKDVEKHLGLQILVLKDGRDIWECAFDDNFLYNSRVANCTVYLKMRMFNKWLKQNYTYEECTIHIGFNWEELHRVEKTKNKYLPYKVEFLMTDKPYLTKNETFELVESLGIQVPRLYKMGFAHNNCGGFCFKAGIGHFRQLYKMLPDRYMYHANKEQELIKKIETFHGKKNTSILKRVKDGEKVNVTLLELKDLFDEENCQISFDDLMDFGGCNCFIE